MAVLDRLTLKFWWNFDQASGVETEEYVGLGTWTDLGTATTSDTGLVYPYARKFTRASSMSMEYGGDGTFDITPGSSTKKAWFVWFKCTTLPTGGEVQTIFDQLHTAGSYTGFRLAIEAGGELVIDWRVNGSAQTQISYGASSVTEGAWHLFGAQFDPLNDKFSYSLDGAAWTDKTSVFNQDTSNQKPRIGANTSGANYFEGLIGGLYVLISNDDEPADWLYNGGAGRSFEAYKDLGRPDIANLRAWFDFEESTGDDAVDEHNGIVVSQTGSPDISRVTGVDGNNAARLVDGAYFLASSGFDDINFDGEDFSIVLFLKYTAALTSYGGSIKLGPSGAGYGGYELKQASNDAQAFTPEGDSSGEIDFIHAYFTSAAVWKMAGFYYDHGNKNKAASKTQAGTDEHAGSYTVEALNFDAQAAPPSPELILLENTGSGSNSIDYDKISLWSGILTRQNLDWLLNMDSGVYQGRTYSEINVEPDVVLTAKGRDLTLVGQGRDLSLTAGARDLSLTAR